VTTDPYYPKDLIRQIYEAASAQYGPPGDDDVQKVLASLPIQVYLSTGFDDLLTLALRNQRKDAAVALARWHEDIEETPRGVSTDGPTQERPLVLHFYGRAAMPESLVLTEDEHLQVLQSLAAPLDEVFPPAVRRAFASSALLLLGVGPTTLSGRTLLAARRAMTKRFLRSSFAVLLPPPDDGSADTSRAQRYLDAYLSQQGIRVYWGSINSFSSELKYRRQSYAQHLK